MQKSYTSFAKYLVAMLTSSVSLFCGSQAEILNQSTVQFTNSLKEKHAILEERDLKDSFLFGISVIDVVDLNSSAMVLHTNPLSSRLELVQSAAGRKLNIITGSGHSKTTYMSFDAEKLSDGRMEVDFSSPGNELNLYNFRDGLASIAPEGSQTEQWRTTGRPQVVKVSQDADVVVVDLKHFVKTNSSDSNHALKKTASVTFRIFLKRQTVLKVQQPQLSLADGLSKHIGYFSGSSDLGLMPEGISRFNVDVFEKKEGQIVVYLKDFPAEYYACAEAAILRWNQAFGFNIIKVKKATPEIDIGDPRYNVVRWLNNLGPDVEWAGIAPTIIDPSSGKVTGGHILINGNSNIVHVKGVFNYSARVRSAQGGFAGLHGKIGNVSVIQGAGETPVVPFLVDPKLDLTALTHGHYFSVIMHEFGHTLGLRHNFAASTILDRGNLPSSVMDYEPTWAAARRTEIGSYDRAAIRWGYFGESPTIPLAYCTDEDVSRKIDCNKSDFGEPVSFTVNALLNGLKILSTTPVPLPYDFQSAMGVNIETAFKIQRLIAQVPEPKREKAKSDLEQALNAVKNSEVAFEGTEEQRKIIQRNLHILHAVFKSRLKNPQN